MIRHQRSRLLALASLSLLTTLLALQLLGVDCCQTAWRRLQASGTFEGGEAQVDRLALVGSGRLSLEGLVTHKVPATEAPTAYGQAFSDPNCLKMVFDWRDIA